MKSVWTYIIVMEAVTYTIRALPMTLLRRPIKSRFNRSFLYYVPYVTLAVMTFPAILSTSGNMWAGLAAFAVGLFLSWRNAGLFATAAGCCAAVLVAGLW